MCEDEKGGILVVDDEESLRDMMTQVFEEEGYRVKAVATGGEGIDALEKMPCKLGFIDLRLPDMSGIEVVKKIRIKYPDMELILITAYASVENAVQALRSGVYDYMTKPVDDIHLLSSIAMRAIEKRKLSIENRSLMGQLKRTVEELGESNRILSDLAVKDGLTGLYNHRYFQEALIQEETVSRRCKREFSLLLMDLDHFKLFNDTNGHQDGDTVLKEFSQLLNGELRSSDISARYGGEEFVVILPETGKKGASQLAEKIRKGVAAHNFLNMKTQPKGYVSVSIGVATFPEDGKDGREIVKKADQALYGAKDGGRNMVCMAGEE